MNIIRISMNADVVRKLIARYYSGESTEDEENLLRRYFDQKDIPDEFEAERHIFGYYVSESDIPEPSADFEARIIAGIDADEARIPSRGIRKALITYMSAAAGLILIIASYFLIINKADSIDTYSDPELAYAETIKILMDVSNKVNLATESLKPVGRMNDITNIGVEALNKSTTTMERNLKNIDYFKKNK